jgi:kynurenine formamidase
MRLVIFFIAVTFFSGCDSETSKTTTPFPNGKWIDLTHAFDEQTIYWPTSEAFQLDTVSEGITAKGYYYAAFQFCAAEHGGTHLDAPIHFGAGKHSVEEIPLKQLMGEAVVVDISGKALTNKDYQVSVEDFQAWEQANGQLPEGAIVLLRTGYGKFWPDAVRYMGTAEKGADAIADLHFPGLHPEAALWLIQNRPINAIGLDTPSIDYGQSSLFESHQILFEKNIPAFENVANLDKLPVKGSWVIALPMKIRGGSGGPLRMVALLPE